LAAALYVVGGIRATFSIGIGAGGPAAYWYLNHTLAFILENNLSFLRSSYVVTSIFVVITAAVLAEICSALPAAGSIYLYVSYPNLVEQPF